MWTEIGNQLKQARESSGLSFRELQEKTQIDTVSLKALERGEFDKIGSAFTVRSYIRVYAKQVGLEPTYLLKRYRPETSVMPAVDQGTAKYHLSALGSLADNNKTNQETDTFKALSSAPPNEDDQYDPFKNHPDRHSDLTAPSYDPYETMVSHDDDEKVSSHSTGRRQTLSKHSGSFQSPVPSVRKSNSGKFSRVEREATRGNFGDEGFSESPPLSRRSRGLQDYGHVSDSGWEGYQETAATEEEMSDWDTSVTPARSGRRSSLSRRSSGVTPAPSTEESGWQERPTLSRSRSGSERAVASYESVPNPPALLHGDEQDRLSRSGRRKQVTDRGKKAGIWIAQKKWVYIAVSVVILLIPMSVMAYNSMKDPANSEASPSKDKVDGADSAADNGSAEGMASLETVSETESLGEYKLSKPDTISVKFKALGSGSWIQIREQQNPDAAFIKDFTLQPGEEYPYEHAQDASNDVWITIGQPDNVVVTINGQEVETVRSIHVARQ